VDMWAAEPFEWDDLVGCLDHCVPVCVHLVMSLSVCVCVCRNHNSITEVDGDALSHATELEVLDLGHNRIRHLSNGSFTSALSSLQHLYDSPALLLI